MIRETTLSILVSYTAGQCLDEFPAPFQCVGSNEPELELSKSQPASRNADALKLKLLEILTQQPGLDDVELADMMGEPAFEISKLLQELAVAGLIQEAV